MAPAVIEEFPGSLDQMALKELRLARVLTQEELAKQAGVSVKTLVDVEKFKVQPHPRTLRKLAAALGVPVTSLNEHMTPRLRAEKPQPGLFPLGNDGTPTRTS